MSKRWLFFSFLLVLMVVLFGGSRPVAAAAPPLEPANTVREITAEEVEGFVDRYIESNMESAQVPGLVVTVVHDGQVILSNGYGYADIATQRPMTAQTNLRAGSVSKPVMSAAVLQLVEQGKIALDEPVSTYITDLPLEDRFGSASTVSQLLTLKGGYADTVLLSHSSSLEEWQPLDEYLAENLEPRAMPPGLVHSYSSWEHALLGYAVEQVSGQPYDRIVDQNLFQPAGMTRTTFSQPLPQDILDNLAIGYNYAGGEYDVVPLDYVLLSPGIALVTTGEDMGRFMLALLNEGNLNGRQIMEAETAESLLTRQEEVHPYSRGRSYGFSEITLAGRQGFYHDGNGIGFGNRMILMPSREFGIFLSINHRPLAPDAGPTPAYRFMRELSTALIERYIPADEVEAPTVQPLADAAERASRYTGHYRLAGTPQNDFFKMGALMDNVDVSNNHDGTITIGSKFYIEVEPLVFQSLADLGFFVIFVEDEQGQVEFLTFGGTGSYKKVAWYETAGLQMALLAAMVLVFLASLIALPFAGRRHWPVGAIALLNLIFVVGVGIMMFRADLIAFFKEIPTVTSLLLLLPWLSAVLVVVLPLYWLKVGRRGSTGRIKIYYGLTTMAAVAFTWFVFYWHLYLP